MESVTMLPRSWFENWRNPKEFFCTAWEQIKPYTGNAPLQYLRDAYVVGLFARIFSYDSRCEVKLSHGKDEFPDARLSFFAPPNEFPNTQVIGKEQRYLADIEIVTADKCLRETWKELRELTEIYRRHEYPPSTDSPKERRKALLEAIPRVVKKKAEKHYTPPPNLLVHLMIAPPPTAPCPLVTIEEMALLTEPYKNDFNSIWILREMDNIKLWPEQKMIRTPEGHDPFDCTKCGD
jgi:hypothetical protein